MTIYELTTLQVTGVHNLLQAMLLVNSRAEISIYMSDPEPMVLTTSLCFVSTKKKYKREAKMNYFKIPSIALSC